MIPLPAPDFKPYQRVPFYEAIQWFRQQAPWISGSSWSTMARLAADKGEQISSTVLLSMLDDVWVHMDRALAEGKPYNEFVKDVAAPIYSRWRQADSPRLKLIYHNNIGNALMAGREAQMRDPAVLAVRPYVMFDGIGDWRQTIDICKPRDGVILPADDPWWEQNSPLLHHGAVESSTLIQTGRGKIPACDVRCGDSVLTHTGAYRKVTTAVHKYVLRAKTRVLHLDSGKVMRVTDEHPILRTGSDGFIWKRADSLKVGDVLLENPDEFGRSLRCGVVNSQDCPSLSDDQRITFQIPGPCFPPGMAFPVQLNGDLEFLKGNIDVELTDRILCCRNRPEDSEQVVLLWGEFFPESIGNATSAKLSNGNRGHWVLERHSAATVCTDTGVGGCLTPEVMVGTATFGNGLGRKSADLDLINSGSDRNAVLFAPDGKPPIGPAVFPLKFSDTPVLAEVLGFNKVSANAPVTDVWSGYKHTRITSISVVVEDTQLSDFTVEVDESYVAGDIVLHNCRSGKITLDAEEVAEFGGVTDKAALTRLAPAQEGWGKPYSWVDWKPAPANYHAPLADEYQRWIQGQEYIHTKAEWDAKWQRVAAEQKFIADAEAAQAAELAKLKAQEAAINDPNNVVVWQKESKYADMKINGIPFQSVVPDYWKTVSDVITGEPPLPVGMGKVATGIIVMEPDGRIWVVEPKDHFGGYEHTFPKGKLEQDLTPQQNALKELYEEAGLAAEITGYIGDFKGTTGVSRYYLAKRTSGEPWTSHWESQAVKLLPVDQAADFLNTERDKEILSVLIAKKTGNPIPANLKTYVAPVLIQPQAQVPTPTPTPVSAWPFGLDPSQYIWHSSKQGGSTPGLIAAHPSAPGDTFMIKQLSDPFKAYAEVAGCGLYSLANNNIISVETLEPSSLSQEVKGRSKYVTVQKMASDVVSLTSVLQSKYAPDFTRLTTEQQAELLAHGIASWISGEHDGHAEQYLIKNERLIRIDLGQALKYTLSGSGDRLDLNYHPNEIYGEARPAHMLLLQAIKEGKVDAAVLHHPIVKEAADNASKIEEHAIDKALTKYGDIQPGGKSRQEIIALLKKRSESVKKDWADLFKSVTGKKFEWEEKVKQKTQRKPKVPKQSEGKKAVETVEFTKGLDLTDVSNQLDTKGAFTVLADGDKLRGQAWHVQKAEIVSPATSEKLFNITGELDISIWQDVEQSMLALDAEYETWESQIRVGLFDPVNDTARSRVLKLHQRSTFLGNAIAYYSPDLKYQVFFGGTASRTAMRGKIKIQVFTDDPVEAQEILDRAMTELNLKNYGLTEKPTPESIALARSNRALWNIEGGAYTPARSLKDALDRLKIHGVDPTSVTARQNTAGFEEPVIEGRWKKYRSMGARYLYHQFKPVSSIVRGVTGADGGKGGLLSTIVRTEKGINILGSSSSADLDTGGASSSFARIVGGEQTGSALYWYSSSHYTAIVSPKILDRTDWYAYNYDNWGRTTTQEFRTRLGSDRHIKTVVEEGQSDNEVMFRNAIGREDILFFAVKSDNARTDLLSDLRAAGVKTIRGQPIEEMVVKMTAPNDFKKLKKKNPVHAFFLGETDTCPEWTETYGDTNE